MTRYKRIWLALFCILLLVTVGCGRAAKPAETPKSPVIAVVDWETLWRAHPLAKEWRQKQADGVAAQRVLAFQEDMVRRQQWFDANMAGGRLLYSDAVLKTKMAELSAKKRELLVTWEQDAREKLGADWRRAADEVEDKYRPELTNLQLKLAVLNLPQEDQKRLEATRAQVLQQRDSELRDRRRALEDQVAKQRWAEDARLSAQLASDSDQAMREFTQSTGDMSVDKRTLDMADQSVLADNRQALLARIEQLRREEAALAEKIENDIRAEAERLSSERKFDVILRKVVVNVNAVDVTQEMVKALQLRAKTQNTINESGERKQ